MRTRREQVGLLGVKLERKNVALVRLDARDESVGRVGAQHGVRVPQVDGAVRHAWRSGEKERANGKTGAGVEKIKTKRNEES